MHMCHKLACFWKSSGKADKKQVAWWLQGGEQRPGKTLTSLVQVVMISI